MLTRFALAAVVLFGVSAASAGPSHPRRTAKPADSVLRQELSPAAYDITQREGTETAFTGAYWANHAAGIYVDVVTGEPLFSSTNKFESGTGWPSFYQPISPAAVVTHHDGKYGWDRTEVRSKLGDSHLGHVFADGPKPTGLRYCINSASLRFIPAADLEREGYGEFAKLFTR